MPLVGIEPRTSRFVVRRSTTMPPQSLKKFKCFIKYEKKDSAEGDTSVVQSSSFYHIYIYVHDTSHDKKSQTF